MTLSKEILQGTYQGVLARLERGETPNLIDEYGFTPLTHAVVTNKPDIVELLLKHHARVDILDTSGLTALHWAVDMSFHPIVEILLTFGADPNAYSTSGQPVMFYPVLRKDRALIQMLADKGGDIRFAKDFILAKLVAHRFELQGKCDIVTTEGLYLEVDMEGFYLEFTLDLISESLKLFVNSYTAKRMAIPEHEVQVILNSLIHATGLRAFKHIGRDVDQNRDEIKRLLNIDLLLLPVSFAGHAITFIKYGSLLAKCDRGVHKMTDPIVIHTIHNPAALTYDFYTHLLYKPHMRKYIQQDIYKILGLTPYVKLPIKHQITGNCSWANVEASIPTMLYMLMHDKLKNKTDADKLVFSIMKFYQAWLEWDKDRCLEDVFLDFDKLSLNRKKARAALLGEVLFQSCNPAKKNDITRAQKILKILSQKDYHFIIRSYLKVFGTTGKTSQGANFVSLLKACGYHPHDFAL